MPLGFKRGKRFLWFLSNSIDYSTNLKTPFQYYESEKRNEEENTRRQAGPPGQPCHQRHLHRPYYPYGHRAPRLLAAGVGKS